MKPKKLDPKAKACLSCYYVGRGRYPGSLWVYPFAYFMFFVPGVLYWIYRAASGQCVCFKCGRKTLVPLDTPLGREIEKQAGIGS